MSNITATRLRMRASSSCDRQFLATRSRSSCSYQPKRLPNGLPMPDPTPPPPGAWLNMGDVSAWPVLEYTWFGLGFGTGVYFCGVAGAGAGRFWAFLLFSEIASGSGGGAFF